MAGESSSVVELVKSTFDIEVSSWLASGLFTVALGAAVFWSTAAVDNLNRCLFSFKGFLLVATIALISPKVDINKIISGQSIEQSKYLWAATPILVCIFAYHFVIPSLRMYVGNKPNELKWILISGTTISLIIYLLWVVVTLGVVPLTGDSSFATADSSNFVNILMTIVGNKWVAASINGFYSVTITTSFLGVSIGLFDFLADGFKRQNTRFGRLQTSCLTFIPPFMLALLWPHGFHVAMIWSACCAAILFIMLPAMMVYRLRKNKELKSSYRTPGGNVSLILIAIIGFILFVLPILRNLNLLPTLK